MTVTLRELAEVIGATLQGDGDHEVSGCATLAEAQSQHVSFLHNPKYIAAITDSRAGAIVISPADAQGVVGRNLLVCKHPYYAFRQAVVKLHGFRPLPAPGISPQACIAPDATIGEGCHIGPFVVVESGAVVGDRSVLYPHTYVGPDARLGEDCILFPNVTIYDRCVLGHRVTLHAGCSIGEDGFGYATHHVPGDPAPAHHKIPQTGIAIIGDDVEMGANCSVDRATLGATVIAAGTKFSNGVTVGHGSKVGRHNLFVGLVGLAGSVTTGDYVALGGQVGVAGHLTIADGAQVAATSGVMNDIPAGEKWGGHPAVPLKQAFRNHSYVQKLPELASKIKHLERRLGKLEAAAE